MPYHLLFPLFSSVVFVVGVMFTKRANFAGSNPWTSTLWSNGLLAICWAGIGLSHGQLLPATGWGPAALCGLSFVLGQLCTYLAYEHGDVSVATPVLGVKVILVAVALAAIGDETVEPRIWIAAMLATLGIGVVQAGVRSGPAAHSARRAVRSLVLALTAAAALTFFDLGLQSWGRRYPAVEFLPATFACTGAFSCVVLPWTDRPARLRQIHALRPLAIGSLLMAIQAMSMSYSLGQFGDAARINIVYALRGLWAVGLAWLLAQRYGGSESQLTRGVMLLRLAGALLLTSSVLMALGDR